MGKNGSATGSPLRLRRYAVAPALAWTIIVAALLAWSILFGRWAIREEAHGITLSLSLGKNRLSGQR